MNVLLSIKPMYVDEILAGKKIFEFRKSIFKKKDISKVFIYSSFPVKKIVASFEIARIIADSPHKIWDKCQKYGGISEKDFFDYFKNSDIGYAIEITNLNIFSEPINPYKIKKDFRPPQSYCYLPLDYFENKNINSILRIKNQDVMFESDNEYFHNIGGNKKFNKIRKQSNLLEGDEFQKMLEQSEKWLKNGMIMEEKFGWIETELSQVAEIIMGQSPPSSTYNENGIGLPFFQGKAEFTELYPIVSKWCSEPNKIAESNDILISVRAPVGATNIANQKCCIGRGLAAIRYPDCNKYVFYFLRLIENELDKKGTGTTFKAISGSVLKSEKIPLAPLPEQRAIVTKIELLFSELDNGISNLKLAQEQLKVYRQAVLKKVFEGELTKKWREQQTDLPDAKDLLEQIRKKREEAAKVSGKKVKSVKPFTKEELVELPKIPEGWTWTSINQICFVDVGFAFKSAEFVDEGIRLLRGDNIEPGSLRWENTKCLPKEKIEDYKNLIVKKNEIILAMDRPLISSGLKLAMAKESDVPCLLVQRMARFLPISVDNKYLYYSLQTKDFIHHLLKGQTGTQLPHISETNISNYVFSLPSIAEQKIIVEEIETRLSVCDKIEQDIKENLEKAEALRQSILKKAFEGKLLNEKELAEVRGAEDWEPAEVLLEKIKVEEIIKAEKEKNNSKR